MPIFWSLFNHTPRSPRLPVSPGAIIACSHETCASVGTVHGAGAGPRPPRVSAGTPIRADYVSRRPRDAWRRRLRVGWLRGPGLLQLHRLRTFRAPPVPRRPDDVNWHGRTFLRPGGIEYGKRRSSGSIRALPADSSLGRPALRHPGRPRPAALWRVRPACVLDRQSADRLSAGLSVSDVASRRRLAAQCGRTPEHARTWLAVAVFARRSHAGGGPAARDGVSLGHWRAGARIQRHG